MSKNFQSLNPSRRDFIKLVGKGAGGLALSIGMLPNSVANAGLSGAINGSRPLPYRVGKWLPSDQVVLDRWLANLIYKVDANPMPLHPVIQEFKYQIERDPEIYMYFHQMFDDLPQTAQFAVNPVGGPQVRDFDHMLALINGVMTTAPGYDKTGLVGFPINAILDWPMGTSGGFAAFLNDKINAQLKKILNEWAKFLNSPESCYVLNDDPTSGWLGRDAMEAMPGFETQFECDPSQPYYGFTSWDNFFTRKFRDGQRPVASPEDDSVIVNACESAPFRIAENVNLYDQFWIKAQPYSLKHMFARGSYLCPVCGWNDLPGLPQRPQLPQVAQPGQRNHRPGGGHRWILLLRDTGCGVRPVCPQRFSRLYHRSSHPGAYPDPGR